MKRRETSVGSSDPKLPFPDAGWAKKYPVLCEYLSHMEYDDGSKRELSTLTVKEQDGRVLLSLNDKDTSSTAYISGEDVAAALASLERALVAGNADWRRWKGSQTAKRKGT